MPTDRRSPRESPARAGARTRLRVGWFPCPCRSTPVHGRDHGRIDVHRKRAPRGLQEPDVEHRGHADVDRTKRARGEWRHQAELESEWRDADVLVLVPRRQRAAGIGAELIDVLTLT